MIAKVLTLVCCVNVVSAQTAVYRAPADTVFLVTSNPHRLYWVSGVDTLGELSQSLTLSAQQWRPVGAGFMVTTRQSDLDVARHVRNDTLNVDVSGHVTIPPGRGGDHGVDFTVHFPAGSPRLVAGFEWADTTRSTHAGGSGPLATRDFNVARRLKVTRHLDTLGARVVEIVCDGNVHYADAWWNDSAAGSFAWMDVRGPTHEVYWFDATAGRLVARRWSMTLRGSGGTPTEHGTDTVPAGLIASESEHVIPASLAHVLARTLPGGDTTFTFSTDHGKVTGIMFAQTERFDSVRMETGFARLDGMVGTALATFDQGRPRTYEAIWTDSAARPVHHYLAVQGDHIILREDLALDTLPLPAIDTSIAAPTLPWTVAEYAMDEMLVPIARTLAGDTLPHDVLVFRPTPRRWDTVRVRVKALAPTPRAALVVTEFTSPRSNPTVMIIAPDGTLLYLEDRRDHGWRRLPSTKSGRHAELESIIKSLNAGGGPAS